MDWTLEAPSKDGRLGSRDVANVVIADCADRVHCASLRHHALQRRRPETARCHEPCGSFTPDAVSLPL
jgi:hypothetical protein